MNDEDVIQMTFRANCILITNDKARDTEPERGNFSVMSPEYSSYQDGIIIRHWESKQCRNLQKVSNRALGQHLPHPRQQ